MMGGLGLTPANPSPHCHQIHIDGGAVVMRREAILATACPATVGMIVEPSRLPVGTMHALHVEAAVRSAMGEQWVRSRSRVVYARALGGQCRDSHLLYSLSRSPTQLCGHGLPRRESLTSTSLR
jgi:hypothetical protein